jgi:RNA polymerase subunit RPABC4/transcription elongation factor Spt4
MPFEIDGITDAIGEFIGSPIIQLGLQALAVYLVVLWLAAAFWAFKDMHGRSDNPLLPYLAAALVIVFTPVFFPLAVVIYRLVRPSERIGEVSERRLAEEALLAEVESIRTCPSCQRRVHDEWIICPTCRTRLNRVCPNCSKLVGLDWSLCAWCGKDFERRPAAEPVPADPAATVGPAYGRDRAAVRPTASRPTMARGQAPRGSGQVGSTDPLPER